ncbi:hypothetical protein NIASO_02325 [Niabella soli DSM 19437]|uniref:Uncharacterized protein n=1 Tax=Niabella soli DSM 19437 TaxID=929713 RepID=W0F6Y1_9BACT|nr:hypothetical protein NIASO_02325 [Niabella soli DSM 19437]
MFFDNRFPGNSAYFFTKTSGGNGVKKITEMKRGNKFSVWSKRNGIRRSLRSLNRKGFKLSLLLAIRPAICLKCKLICCDGGKHTVQNK